MLLEQELLALGIERAQAEKMAAYGARLEEVNQSFNLTRITSPKEMAQKHFYDSLAPVRLGVLQPGQRVLDIGTGAGFPGVPLAIAGLKVTMLDSSEKKIGFVRKSCEALGISAQCIWGRAEELAHLWQNEPLDAVVARAVARLPMLLELGSAFIKTGGLFVAYKGEAAQEEAEEARSAAKTLNMRLEKIRPAGLSGREHQLVIYKKLGQTPKGYPRKFAKIKARPL